MPYDLGLTRAILHEFGTRSDTGEYIRTDGMTFSPPHVVRFGEERIPQHVGRLIEIGLLRRTHEIRMKYHPDPVTLRATEAGSEWVRRAWSESDWQASAPTLQRLLEEPETA